MITSLLLAASIVVPAEGPAIVCPMTGEALPAEAKAMDLNGIRFRFCCPGCAEGFQKQGLAVLNKAKEKGWVVGVGVFDPVSGRKLTPETAKGGSSDFGGIRFAFQNAANKAKFDADPKTYGAVPEKWASICPVMGLELANTYTAPGYVDAGGVRMFACCEVCFPRLKAKGESFAKQVEAKTGAPKAFEVPAAFLKITGPGF